MAHISLSPPNASEKFNPLGKFYDRDSKDGLIPQILYLLGSQYNVPIGGETSVTSVGNITNDTAKAISGKLEIAAESVDGTEVEKIVSFTPFMYFYPTLKIVGECEVQDDDVGSGPIPVQRIRHEFEDLANTDKLIIDWQGGDGNAQFVVSEVVDGTTTTLVTYEATAGIKNIKWEVSFLEDGVTKIFIKEPGGDRTRIFNGNLNSVIGEAKVSVRLMLDQQTTKTVKSDFVWNYYNNIFTGYDVALDKRLNGRIRVFDTNGTEVEADWIEVFSSDHPFVGDRVIENALIRIRIKSIAQIEVFGWNTTSVAWESIGSVIPVSSLGDIATDLQDVIIEKFNNVFIRMTVRFGIIDFVIRMRRGQPVIRIVSNSKEVRVNTTARRFALSTDVDTDIPDFNQKNTDDANRGNPLNLSPTNNPFVFTNDTNINTGIQLVDDNWYAWYDENDSNNMVGFLGCAKDPTGLTVTATTATQLEKIEWTFDKDMIYCIGVLEGDPTQTVNGIPSVFNIGDIDTYVKWRANEGIFGLEQGGFVKKRR